MTRRARGLLTAVLAALGMSSWFVRTAREAQRRAAIQDAMDDARCAR